MHFAYPPRKSSNPAPFRPRTSKIPTLRRGRLKTIAIIGFSVLFLLWLFSRGSGGASGSSRTTIKAKPPRPISGKPAVVVVTVLDVKGAAVQSEYVQSIRQNRLEYAEKHGYGTHIVEASDYDLSDAPPSWAKVVAVRHALTKFPDARYFWYLDQDSFVMNPNARIDTAIMSSTKLEAAMIKDQPVVPPDSIIKTFSHLKGDDVNFVLTQDTEGLAVGSFVVRNGEWARYFLDTWFDPLYRTYNFQKAETHALEHIVQWHPTILSKLAVIPQRAMNAYSRTKYGEKYEEGDFVVRFPSCNTNKGDYNCADEAASFTAKWKQAFGSK